jgi:hypothetical protein
VIGSAYRKLASDIRSTAPPWGWGLVQQAGPCRVTDQRSAHVIRSDFKLDLTRSGPVNAGADQTSPE